VEGKKEKGTDRAGGESTTHNARLPLALTRFGGFVGEPQVAFFKPPFVSPGGRGHTYDRVLRRSPERVSSFIASLPHPLPRSSSEESVKPRIATIEGAFFSLKKKQPFLESE
jgi:hypothetical protein